VPSACYVLGSGGVAHRLWDSHELWFRNWRAFSEARGHRGINTWARDGLMRRRITSHWRVAVIAATGCLFAALALAGSFLVSNGSLNTLGGALLEGSVSIGVFAVSFAFLAFQLSPYRSLVAGVPFRLLMASAFVMLVAVAPLAGVYADKGAARIGLVTIPLGAYLGLLLVVLAQREVSADRLLAVRTGSRYTRAYLNRFLLAAATQIREDNRLDDEAMLGPGGAKLPPPLHELDAHVTPPPLSDDPVELCVALASAAQQRDDAYGFAKATGRCISLLDEWVTLPLPQVSGVQEYELRRAVMALPTNGLRRIATGSRTGKGEHFAAQFVDICAHRIRTAPDRASSSTTQSLDLATEAADVCAALARERRRGPEAISLLTACRQVSERLLRAHPEFMEEFRLASYSSIVGFLAEAAIEADDAELVYRCAETLGWIGCAAVRYGADETTRRTAELVVEIARQARAAHMECFWDRCARTPYDHAVQHLEWMISWSPNSSAGAGSYLGVLGHACSRLLGYEVLLTLDASAQPPQVVPSSNKSQPWVESVHDHGTLRQYDYSKVDMVRRHALH
jgi:hypothetical protein